MQTAPKYPYPTKLYKALDRCAYCSTTKSFSADELTDEHIIPFGFGGKLVLPKASCRSHQKATSRVEEFILRKYLCALRSHLRLPSRKPNLRPNGYKLTLRSGNRSWQQKVTLSDHPGLVRFMVFADPPGAISGRSKVQETWNIRAIDAEIFPDIKKRLARLGADGFEDKVQINGMMLARWIAKIGHSFAIAELGYDAFEATYVNKLVNEETPDWNYWVGGYDHGRKVPARDLHELRLLRRSDDLSVIVHLLVPYCPQYAYEVVVGRLRAGIEISSSLQIQMTAS